METVLSAKEFMLENWNPYWATDFFRMQKLFTQQNATVFYIQCDAGFDTWTVSVAREGRYACENSETSKFIRNFLGRVGIKIRRDELVLSQSGNRLKVLFNHKTNERGKRVTLARLHRGQIVPAFEELVMPAIADSVEIQ